MTESNMSREFYEWLDECPVNWRREPIDIINNEAVYRFMEYTN